MNDNTCYFGRFSVLLAAAVHVELKSLATISIAAFGTDKRFS